MPVTNWRRRLTHQLISDATHSHHDVIISTQGVVLRNFYSNEVSSKFDNTVVEYRSI